jgi:hypothetical protein
MVMCPVTEFAGLLQSRGKEDGNGCISFLCSWFESLAVACIRCSLIRFSVFDVWFLLHPSL